MAPTVQRFFVTINGAQIHVRRVGEGPPVLLLHPSPQSGTFSLPMALKLAASGFTAIAVDLPGYGLSDPLVGGYPENLSRDHGLDPYLPPLVQLLDALGIAKAVIYGNATGAEISHIFAYNHPDRVAVAMLDTAGHNPDEAVDKLTDGYFPDVTPRRDGGHLLTYWDMVQFLSVFAPWQFTDKAHRLPVDQPPADRIHDKLIEYLRAGTVYATAYRPAFYTAKGNLIGRVKTPATLTRWEGKANIAEIDALIAYGLPQNFTVLRPGPTMDERLDASVGYLRDHYKSTGATTPPQPAQIDKNATRLQKIWIDVPGGQVLGRVCLAGTERPLLVLHDAARSSVSCEEILAPYIGHRPVIAIDNPGAGESDRLLTPDDISIEGYARFALLALDTLEISEVDVIGCHMGGQVGMELSTLRPGLVKHLALAGMMIFDEAERSDLLANYAPSLKPQWNGSHLVAAWSMVRDMQLFWPWYNRSKDAILKQDAKISGADLQDQVVDLLKMGDAYQHAYKAAFTYPTLDKLKILKVPCLAADQPGSGTYAKLAVVQQAAPHIDTATLPVGKSDWATIFSSFFAR